MAGAVLMLPVTAGAFLPPRLALFVPPGDPHWEDAHVLWGGVLAAGAMYGPEPRRRPGGGRGGRPGCGQ
ncbi:hypothetical protein ACFYO2_04260 [Streptomyces sp. NPDC006602]|uniref:hypothetical protein n=1 Tax=Streptomyces sp. NPDC006602 TaxID=3364751 RepID=UPI00368A8357